MMRLFSCNDCMKVVLGLLFLYDLTAAFVASNDATGFDLLFKTVMDEPRDENITFDKPIPRWIKGSLIRNGPARYEVGNRSFLNLYDGYGKLNVWKFHGNENNATFSCKFIQSQSLKDSVSENDISAYLAFDTTIPPQPLFKRETALMRGIDNMNVNVYNYAGECVVLSDAWKLYVVNCSTLETIRPVTAKVPEADIGFPFMSMISSAHPIKEAHSNSYLTVLSSLSLIPSIPHKRTLVRIKSPDVHEMVAQWNVEKMGYLHSFSTTANYAVILVSPYYMDTAKMLEYGYPKDSMEFHKDEPAITYIINLNTGDVTTIETENVFVMHNVNAYETDKENIVLDVVAHPDTVQAWFYQCDIVFNETKRNSVPFHPKLKRFHINLKEKSMRLSAFEVGSLPFTSSLEVPTINEQYRSKHYCYVYGSVFKSDERHWGNFTFVKKDLCNTTGDSYWSQENHYPLEGWFLPDPAGKNEDDGVLMLPVLDGNERKSYLLILDARDLHQISKAYLNVVIPFHFHGRFMEDLS